jgi:hypothetical protein
MLAARTGLLVAIAALSALAAVACSAPADSSKKPLPVCDAKDPECPGVPASSNKAHTDVPTDPVVVPDQTPAPAADPTPAATSPEAGVDAAPVMGKECTALSTCCGQLKDAGYDTTICKSILSTNNEDACWEKHASYKDGGDCT